MSPAFQCFHPQCENARRVHRRAEQLGLPILTHAAMQSISETPMEWANPILYDAVAREFPNLKIVLAHIGIPWFWDALVVVRKHPNVYADITGICRFPWWGYQALSAFSEFGAMNKLLFGSDFPFFTVEDSIQALRGINRFAENNFLPQIPEDEIEGIIHRNSLKLLELE